MIKPSVGVTVTCPITKKTETCYFIFSQGFSNGCNNMHNCAQCEDCCEKVSNEVKNNLEKYTWYMD